MNECVLYENVNAANRLYFDLNMNSIVCMCVKMCIPVTCESLLSSQKKKKKKKKEKRKERKKNS